MAGSRYLKRKNNRHLTRLTAMLLGGLLIVGCGGGSQWDWHHPDADYAKTHRAEDVHECESYADEVSDNGPADEVVFGRNYGGWGNTDVELCMAAKDWSLRFGNGAKRGGGLSRRLAGECRLRHPSRPGAHAYPACQTES